MSQASRATTLRDALGSASFDSLLRFGHQIAHRYDAEHGHSRLRELRSSIYVGLALYNIFNLTAIGLMPDILHLSLVMRLLVVTPASLALAWSLARLAPPQREWLVLAGMFNAYAVPLFLFWLTRSALGDYSFGELALILIFGNMLLALRFRMAIIFTGGCLFATIVAVLAKSSMPGMLQFSLVCQSIAACLFSLYANYRIEHRRCTDYLESLAARLRSKAAEESEQVYRGLSMTDPLTGLPNRRALDYCMADWISPAHASAVLMIDVDYFKPFNDMLGHAAGDRVLCEIASRLDNAARQFAAETDGKTFCARFGGEEFVVVATGSTQIHAAKLAKSLSHAVRSPAIEHPNRLDDGRCITVSIGIALAEDHSGTSPVTVLVSADTALYEAKRLGRDRFVFARRASAMPTALASR